MNKEHSINQELPSKKEHVHFKFTLFSSSSDIWILAIALFALLLISFITEAQTYPASFSQVQVASGISNPTAMEFAPDGRIFVAQQSGALRVIKNGVLLTKPFITVAVNSSGERGLLGIAFDPAFNNNHYIYLYYTLSTAANNRVSRFTANGDTVVPGSEVLVLDLSPLSSATNHNGGSIHFGPDAKLYIATGDNANNNNSQSLTTYLGKILRVNADGTIPSGNPFTTGGAQQMRIWSYGLRNPYTFCFQPGTGKIFINDVGELTWEEINDATIPGLNYGWSVAEGNSTNASFTNPVYYYGHGTGTNLGCAITGGTFFNSSATNYPSSYTGKYFYMDYCGKWIDVLTYNGSTWSHSGFAANLPGHPVAITTGPDGNLYFLSRDNSAIYKIIYTTVKTLDPVADSYVRSGVNTNTNYGTSAVMHVRKAGATTNNDEMIYLRFNISTIGTSVSSAVLRLYGNLNTASASAINADVRNVASQTWGEATLTYTNKPSSQPTIYGSKSISATTPQYYEWNITSLIQQQKNAGATTVSVVLKASTSVAGVFVKLNSKEAAANKPQMVVTSANALIPLENESYKTVAEFSDNNVNENDVTIFPNPATGQITIQLSADKGNSTIKIVDLNGKTCMMERIAAGNNIFSTKGLANGMYTLIIESKEATIRKKLQIIK